MGDRRVGMGLDGHSKSPAALISDLGPCLKICARNRNSYITVSRDNRPSLVNS